MKATFRRLFGDDEGTILAEALIVVPFITIFAVGILEFGNVFWQRHLLEVGVRDAARYWSRCRPNLVTGDAFMNCSIDIARNIAFYGKPNPAEGEYLRVPNWYGEDALVIEPAVPPTVPADTDIVFVKGEVAYASSPLIGLSRPSRRGR